MSYSQTKISFGEFAGLTSFIALATVVGIHLNSSGRIVDTSVKTNNKITRRVSYQFNVPYKENSSFLPLPGETINKSTAKMILVAQRASLRLMFKPGTNNFTFFQQEQNGNKSVQQTVSSTPFKLTVEPGN